MPDIFSLEGEVNAWSRELAASLVLLCHSGHARPMVIEEKPPIVGGRKCRNCGLQTNTTKRLIDEAVSAKSAQFRLDRPSPRVFGALQRASENVCQIAFDRAMELNPAAPRWSVSQTVDC
jgi:hypothetical protein